MLRKLDLLAKIGRRGKVMENKKMKEKGVLGLLIVRILYRKGIGLPSLLGCSPLGFEEAQP
jgi:hypothetical protein